MAQAEQQHIGLHTREYTHTHTSSVARRTAGRSVCVCVCLKAFHLIHASAFSHAGMFAFALSHVPLCVCTGACVCASY